MSNQVQHKHETEEMIAMNTARQRVYQLLSSLYAKELDRPMINELNGETAQNFWQQLATEPQFAPHIQTLVDRVHALTSKEQQLELAADYCGLFLVGTRNSASPYASLYNQNKEDLLFGELHHQIIAFLKQHKLQVQSDFVEPADHIAVILAYAGHLAINADIDEQTVLLKGYLANWLPTFASQVKQSDPSGFYTAVTQLTLAWVTSELEWLTSISA